MKNKNKYILVFIIILLLGGIFSLKVFYSNNENSMNSINTILSNSINKNVSSVDIKKFDLTKMNCKFLYNASEDSPKMPIKFKGFYGIYVLDSINLKKGDSINLDFDSSINEGNFNIVIIDSKSNAIKTIESNSSGRTKIQVNEDGEYKVAMLGEKASGQAVGYWYN